MAEVEPDEERPTDDSVQQYVREEVSSSIHGFFGPLFAVLPELEKCKKKRREYGEGHVVHHSQVKMPLPIGGARPKDVSVLTRIGWILGIVLGIALTFGSLVAGIEALVRLLR